jgi:uncharacterized membrane protein YraQ (UPF0718 family)
MMKFLRNNKFLVISLLLLVIMTFVDVTLTYTALENTGSQLLDMLLIVPPIFLLIGLFDVWVDRETVIRLMGQSSGIKGMALAFFLGAFSAGPTIAAFPLAMVMLKKGARYSNVLFFLMVWSSLKLPIVFFQVTQLGFSFAMLINVIMLAVFIVAALISEKLYTKSELEAFERKAEELS